MIDTINSLLPFVFIVAACIVVVQANKAVERQDLRHRKETKELMEMMLAAQERRDVYMLAKNIADVENPENKVQSDVLKEVINFHQINKIKANQIGV